MNVEPGDKAKKYNSLHTKFHGFQEFMFYLASCLYDQVQHANNVKGERFLDQLEGVAMSHQLDLASPSYPSRVEIDLTNEDPEDSDEN